MNFRSFLLVVAALAAGIGALFVAASPFWRPSAVAPEPNDTTTKSGLKTSRRPGVASEPLRSGSKRLRPGSPASGIDTRSPILHARPERWSSDDYEAVLEELREILPNNVYWDWAAPTRDADILGRRQARDHRMARRRAEIEANLVDEAEIDAFYAEQQGDSADYVVFFSELLARRGAEMTERDVGLAQMAIDIHQTRLVWIPRRMDEAKARRAAYLERKSRWLAAGKPAGLEWDTGPSNPPGAP